MLQISRTLVWPGAGGNSSDVAGLEEEVIDAWAGRRGKEASPLPGLDPLSWGSSQLWGRGVGLRGSGGGGVPPYLVQSSRAARCILLAAAGAGLQWDAPGSLGSFCWLTGPSLSLFLYLMLGANSLDHLACLASCWWCQALVGCTGWPGGLELGGGNGSTPQRAEQGPVHW